MSYRQAALFAEDSTQIREKREDQWFDRKSITVSADKLANLMVSFANADGGTILIGVEDDGRITGVSKHAEHLNALRQVPLDKTVPPVRARYQHLPCTNDNGEPDEVLLIEIDPADRVHRTNRGTVYVRHGDQTRSLDESAVVELTYDRGEHRFDDAVIDEARMKDLDSGLLDRFADAVGVPGDVARALRVRGLTTDEEPPRLRAGAVLLFGTNPEMFIPNASIRILRYDGRFPRTGTRLNLSMDQRLTGPLSEQITRAESLMRALLPEETRLDPVTGRFVTTTEIPRFAWLEAIVNAVTHRSYSLQGDCIRVSIYDDRVEIQNPGRLPGPVRIDNIRSTRFSRNPRIARALTDLGIARELNEGVPRMFQEMAATDLPEPEFGQLDAGFKVTLSRVSGADSARVRELLEAVPDWMLGSIHRLIADRRITTAQTAKLGNVVSPTARRHLQRLEELGLIQRVGTSTRDPHAYWELRVSIRGVWQEPHLVNIKNDFKNANDY